MSRAKRKRTAPITYRQREQALKSIRSLGLRWVAPTTDEAYAMDPLTLTAGYVLFWQRYAADAYAMARACRMGFPYFKGGPRWQAVAATRSAAARHIYDQWIATQRQETQA